MTDTMDSTVDLLAPDWVQSFHAAATAAAAALGLGVTPVVSQPGSTAPLPVPATLGAALPVAGSVQGDLVLLTTAVIEADVDDRALGGLTALSNRVRALRAAADVLGARYGEPQEIDPSDTSADLAAVLVIDGQPVGILAVRVPRPVEQPTALTPTDDYGTTDMDSAATAPAAPTAIPVPVPTREEQLDPGFRSFVPGDVGAGHGPVATRLDQLTHVEMEVTVEIGRARMTVGSLLGLAPGQVVELDRPAGAPVDLFVNGTLLARGEVVVVDEDFGFRVTEIVTSREG